MAAGLKTRLFLSFILLAGFFSPGLAKSAVADTEAQPNKEAKHSNVMGRAASDCTADLGRILLRISNSQRQDTASGRASSYCHPHCFSIDNASSSYFLKVFSFSFSSLHLRKANPSQAP